MGTHYLEPQVDIIMPGQPRVSYAHITAEKVPELLESVLRRNDLEGLVQKRTAELERLNRDLRQALATVAAA